MNVWFGMAFQVQCYFFNQLYIVILLGMEMRHIIIHFTGLADSLKILNLQNRYDFVYQFGTGRCARYRMCLKP